MSILLVSTVPRHTHAARSMEIGPLRTARRPVPIQGTLATRARTLRVTDDVDTLPTPQRVDRAQVELS
ncbi:hypothetical protein ACFWNQ_36825 [Streptomyces virginiae]|uniref:hypothetical protein n=1 Tax=Streptomyces virginiae TaxID=1961 RepID=UPI003646417C